MKDSYYFPHDYNARGDEKIVKLLIVMGWEGYGLFWGVAETMYEAGGSIEHDLDSLAFALRTTREKLAKLFAVKVGEDGLFYRKGSKVGSRSVDRRLAERRAKSEMARKSASVRYAKAEPTHEKPLLERKKVEKERKEITTAQPASAVDFSRIRFPYGIHKGVHICNLPVDECQLYLKDGRMGATIRAALQARIAAKNDEMTDGQRKAQGIP